MKAGALASRAEVKTPEEMLGDFQALVNTSLHSRISVEKDSFCHVADLELETLVN